MGGSQGGSQDGNAKVWLTLIVKYLAESVS